MGLLVPTAWTQQPAVTDAATYERTVSKAITFLSAAQQDNGAWTPQAGPAVTALATHALMRHGRTPQDPAVSKGLENIASYVKPDGGIYNEGSNHRNYETCLAVMCLSAANQQHQYDAVLAGAEKFLKQLQWNDDEGHDASSFSYGGAGYGSHQRPDLSNTTFFVEALKELSVGPDDDAMKQALLFVSRCQNLETEHNASPHAAKVNDGGFYYTVAAGGSSQAGETANGGLRSYASMTYAGLKTMLFAGVDKDDQRVQAAYKWITRHYSLEENPGMGQQGLYYYYHTFAKALDAMKVDTIKTATDGDHNWRADLVSRLAGTQRADGAWVNAADRWMESDPSLVTSYCLMALSYAKPAAE